MKQNDDPKKYNKNEVKYKGREKKKKKRPLGERIRIKERSNSLTRLEQPK